MCAIVAKFTWFNSGSILERARISSIDLILYTLSNNTAVRNMAKAIYTYAYKTHIPLQVQVWYEVILLQEQLPFLVFRCGPSMKILKSDGA